MIFWMGRGRPLSVRNSSKKEAWGREAKALFSIARFSRTPGEVRFAGRALGADTEAVLGAVEGGSAGGPDDGVEAGSGRETSRGASA